MPKHARIPLSKKTRFEIFKRDGFTCQYCGRNPPTVILEVDHVKAVADGGTNDVHNLITACSDCNNGKGAKNLEQIIPSLQEQQFIIKERREQVRRYELLLKREAKRIEDEVDRIAAIFTSQFAGWYLTDLSKSSIKRFLTRLTPYQVEQAMQLACMKMGRDSAFKYFCGICWKIIKGDG